MDDTRLTHATGHLRDAAAYLGEVLDDGPRDVHDAVHLASAVKLLRAAMREVEAAAKPMLCHMHTVAGQCTRPLAHPGEHMAVVK